MSRFWAFRFPCPDLCVAVGKRAVWAAADRGASVNPQNPCVFDALEGSLRGQEMEDGREARFS
jgi:hypothetical protein